MKALVLLAALVGASGDAVYVKQTDPVTLNGTQTTAVASFIATIAPSVLISDVTAIHCFKQSANVVCVVQSNATAPAATYLSDMAAGRVANFVGIAP